MRDLIPDSYPLHEVAERLGVSVRTLKRRSRLGKFPRLIQVTTHSCRVIASDLRSWCEERGIPFADPQPQGEQA